MLDAETMAAGRMLGPEARAAAWERMMARVDALRAAGRRGPPRFEGATGPAPGGSPAADASPPAADASPPAATGGRPAAVD